jgi:hypothetical protein
LSCPSNSTAWARSSAIGWAPGESMTSLVSLSAVAEERAIRSSRLCAASSRPSAGTTSMTSPAARAAGASRVRPASRTCLAIDSPTSSGRRQDAQARLRVAEDRAGAGDAEVAGVGEFRAAAQRPAVHGSQGGHRQPPHPFEQPAVDAPQGVVAPAPQQFGDVGAAGEDPAVPGEQQQPGVALQQVAHLVQLGDHPAADGVAGLGPVQGDLDPVLALLDQQRPVAGGHTVPSGAFRDMRSTS